MISVVTITFNNYDELCSTLDSIKGVEGISSVVINGGGCAKTKSFLAENSALALSEEDKGISDAFNKGHRLATEDYVTYLNSGDGLIDKEYYQSALGIFESHPEVDFIYADILLSHTLYGNVKVTPNLDMIGKMPFPHPSLIVKKKVFTDIGGFDLDLKVAMDYDFVYRMIAKNYKGFYYDKNPVIQMSGGGISSTQALPGLRERIIGLKRSKSFSFGARRYLYVLFFKALVIGTFKKMGILGHYYKIKTKFPHSPVE